MSLTTTRNGVLAGEFDGLLAAVGKEDLVFILEDDADGLPRPLLVIDDKEDGLRGRALRRAGTHAGDDSRLPSA